MAFNRREADGVSLHVRENTITRLGRLNFESWARTTSARNLRESLILHRELYSGTFKFGVLSTVKALTTAGVLAGYQNELPLDIRILGYGFLAGEAAIGATCVYFSSAARDATRIIGSSIGYS